MPLLYSATGDSIRASGHAGDRTRDLRSAKPVLSQLSYTPGARLANDRGSVNDDGHPARWPSALRLARTARRKRLGAGREPVSAIEEDDST